MLFVYFKNLLSIALHCKASMFTVASMPEGSWGKGGLGWAIDSADWCQHCTTINSVVQYINCRGRGGEGCEAALDSHEVQWQCWDNCPWCYNLGDIIVPRSRGKQCKFVSKLQKIKSKTCGEINILIDALVLSSIGSPILLIKYLTSPVQNGFYCSDYSIHYPYHKSTIKTSKPQSMLPSGLVIQLALKDFFSINMNFEVAGTSSKTQPATIVTF